MRIARRVLNAVLLVVLALTLSSCGDSRKYKRAIYLLIDTSGTYKDELPKAQRIINYLLGTMNPGDSFAVARVKSRSFSEKDIIAKVTFTKDPMAANDQKRAFRNKVDRFARGMKRGSAHTDITGGIIQGALFLNETGAGRKTIVIFSDMREELDKKTKRNFPIEMSGIKIVAVNVTKLRKDNIDPRLYLGRLDWWKKRVLSAGASDWKVVNDMEHLERVFQK
jgi:hypothetical protein